MTREPTITRNTSDGGQSEGRVTESEISKKTFVGSVGAALTVLMLLLFATVSMNAVTAAFSPGIGGINATFGDLHYNDTMSGYGGDAHIYPTTTVDTAACAGGSNSAGTQTEIPALTADIPGSVSVTELTVAKTINTSSFAANPVISDINNVTVEIKAAQNTYLNLSEPTLVFSGLDARWLNLSGGVWIYENHSNGTAQAPYLGSDGEFHINATNIRMEKASAYAHLVGFQSLQLPNQSLGLVFNKPGSEVANDTCGI